MTLMVPDAKFSIGSSSTTAASSGEAGGVDMSLDDMIKNRRKEQMTRARRGAAARKPSAVDRVQGRGRAKRAAAINARRGIKNSSNTKKPTAMEMEREVYKQSRRSQKAKESSLRKASGGRLPKTRTPKKKAPPQQSNNQKKKAAAASGKKGNKLEQIPPAWVAGTRRPPSRKAVAAAANAMNNAGFRVPEGMQMVISFAPAPDSDPTNSTKKNNPKKSNNNRGGRRK